jgi:transcriptional regulator with XRE-family HTH domain
MANLLLVRDLCERKKMTIRELAQRIDRDESTIQSAIRRGSTNSMTIEAIAKVLGVPAGMFFDGFQADKQSELEKEVTHLKELLKEKERTIDILMADRKK